ncbi:helix-turn-helix domain-containing protein [Luedemannella helvata]|uniref:Helix-turn-helix domain-containing protein n=1 Tax=Luedemannella helvata TaxID=349315 RepID=A0ABP4XCK4_9ACTN
MRSAEQDPSAGGPRVQAAGIDPADLLTGDEVAARLRATPRFVRRLVAERRITYVKVGRLVRFEPAAVDEYIERNRVVPLSRAELRRRLRAVA